MADRCTSAVPASVGDWAATTPGRRSVTALATLYHRMIRFLFICMSEDYGDARRR
jgi:hypothetical protein